MSDNQALDLENNVLIEGQDNSDQGGNSKENKKVSFWSNLKKGIVKNAKKVVIGFVVGFIVIAAGITGGIGGSKMATVSNNINAYGNNASQIVRSIDVNFNNILSDGLYINESSASSETQKELAQEYIDTAQVGYVNGHTIYGDYETDDVEIIEGVSSTANVQDGTFLSYLNEADTNRYKNAFSAYESLQNANLKYNELVKINSDLCKTADEIKILRNNVSSKEEGLEEGIDEGISQGESTTQGVLIGTIQAIINGDGEYFNLTKSEDVVKYINGYLVDSDSNGKADLLEVVEDIENDKSIPEAIRTAARSEWDKIYTANESAQSEFQKIKSYWDNFKAKADSGDNVGAVAIYNNQITPCVNVLNQCKNIVDNGYKKITEEFASLIQQDQEITGQFSQEDINRYKNAFTQVGSFGEISEVLYNYNKSTGKLNIILTGTNLFNTSEKIRTIYTLNTNTSYNNLDANSVMQEFKNSKNTKVENFVYSNSYENSSAIVSNNGISENITGTMDVWYNISSKYNSTTKKTTITVNAQIMLDDGTIVEKGISSINVNGKPTKSEVQAYGEQLINKTVSSMSNVELGEQIINEIERN